MYFRYFVIISPGKRYGLQLNKLESPTPKDVLCQFWFKLAQWFWRRRWKCEKFTTTTLTKMTTTTTDKFLIRKAHLWWAQNRGQLFLKMFTYLNQTHVLCKMWTIVINIIKMLIHERCLVNNAQYFMHQAIVIWYTMEPISNPKP